MVCGRFSYNLDGMRGFYRDRTVSKRNTMKEIESQPTVNEKPTASGSSDTRRIFVAVLFLIYLFLFSAEFYVSHTLITRIYTILSSAGTNTAVGVYTVIANDTLLA
jgi:hypothetical protein